MSFKIRSVNGDTKLWTKLVDEMEDLENRDEMASPCCFQICCIDVCCINVGIENPQQ